MEDAKLCQRCKKREANPYWIHYGKVVEKSPSGQTQELVEPVGSEQVFLCDRCVSRSQFLWILLAVGSIPIGVLLISSMEGALPYFGIIGAGAGIIALIYLFKSKKDERGSWAAQDFRGRELAAQGYDKTWRPSETKSMRLTKPIEEIKSGE